MPWAAASILDNRSIADYVMRASAACSRIGIGSSRATSERSLQILGNPLVGLADVTMDGRVEGKVVVVREGGRWRW